MDNISSPKRESEAFAPAQEQVPSAKVLVIRHRAAPTDDIYVLLPLRRLVSLGKISLQVLDFAGRLRTTGQLLPHLQDCTHVIVSRYCPEAWVKALLEYPDRPFQICYLVDDDIPAGATTSNLPLTYRIRMAKVARQEFSKFLRGADRVLVTSRNLAAKYQAENVTLLPPPNIWPIHSLDHFHDPETIVVSFHATAIHQGDLAAIAPALRQVHDLRPRVRLEIMTDGRVPRYLRQLTRCRVRSDLPWSKYKEFVQCYESHIGLAPLMESPFNGGKSHIKMFDITAMGATGIYSNRSPYADVIEDRVTGLLANDEVDAWAAALIELVDNPDRAKRMAEAAQVRVAEIGSLERHKQHWAKIFKINDS